MTKLLLEFQENLFYKMKVNKSEKERKRGGRIYWSEYFEILFKHQKKKPRKRKCTACGQIISNQSLGLCRACQGIENLKSKS